MFYEKSKSFDEKLFKNPTEKYRGAPFWAWNGKLNEKMLEEQINCFKEMGFGGFHIHPRAGLDEQYLGEKYMRLVKYCADKAAEKNMLAYLYDEDKAPSGFAGGLATKEPRYCMRCLRFTQNKMQHTDIKTAAETEENALLGVYDVKLNEKGEIISYLRIDENDKPTWQKWYAYMVITKKEPWYNNERYGDLLNIDATKNFINITYEKYKETVGGYFGTVVPSIFTDEPLFHKKIPQAFALGGADSFYPWTPEFEKGFAERYGYNILDCFPEIVWNKEGGRCLQPRYHYHDYAAERLAACFVDALANWCKENSIALTGHMLWEISPYKQTENSGDVMRCYRNMEIPGIDILCNNVELGTAKQCQSVKNQLRREAMASEMYGVTGWDFDFRGYKFQGDWQAALGVTIRVPHLSWTAMQGEAKRDYPASFNYQSPWWREYKYIEDHFARINVALSRGKPCVKVAVIHPLESMYLAFGPKDTCNDLCRQLDENFSNITNWLLRGGIDFDFINESMLPMQYKDSENGFCVGAMTYDAVIITPCLTLRSSTLERLKKFSKKGGKLIFAGQAPRYADALFSNGCEELAEKNIRIPFERCALLDALKDERDIDILNTDGTRTDNLIYNLREDNKSKWLFIASCVQPECKEITDAQKLIIRVKGEYAPVLYNTLNGKTENTEFKLKNNATEIYINRYQSDSILLRLGEPKKASISENKVRLNHIKTLYFPAEAEYELEEENVLILDRARYSLDNSPIREEEEILRLDNICRAELSMPPRGYDYPQPWVIPHEVTKHSIKLYFTINSETELCDVKLASENIDNAKITLNNKPVISKVCGYYTDRSIKKIALPGILKGENTLTMQLPLGLRTNTEWCYLLGNFGVKLSGRKAVIVPAQEKIGYMSLDRQKMPFYGGNVIYRTEIETQSCTAVLHINHFRGALIRVFIDGEDIGRIAFSPYALSFKLEKGKHKIKLVLYGHRFNTFGALHCVSQLEWAGSPPTWRTDGDEWCYEYVTRELGILSAPRIEIFE